MVKYNVRSDDLGGAFYNSIAPSWDHLRAHARPWWRSYRASVPEGSRVLDVGCGNGRLLELFESQSIEYTGIDSSAEMIQRARARLQDTKYKILNTQFFMCDMRSLPFRSHSFDAVFCLAAFHHLETVRDRRRALQEFHRVLRPNGILVLETWNLRALRFFWRYRNYRLLLSRSGDSSVPWILPGRQLLARFYHSFTVRELSLLVNDAGFALQWCEYRTKGVRRHWYNGDELCSMARASSAFAGASVYWLTPQ